MSYIVLYAFGDQACKCHQPKAYAVLVPEQMLRTLREHAQKVRSAVRLLPESACAIEHDLGTVAALNMGAELFREMPGFDILFDIVANGYNKTIHLSEEEYNIITQGNQNLFDVMGLYVQVELPSCACTMSAYVEDDQLEQYWISPDVIDRLVWDNPSLDR